MNAYTHRPRRGAPVLALLALLAAGGAITPKALAQDADRGTTPEREDDTDPIELDKMQVTTGRPVTRLGTGFKMAPRHVPRSVSLISEARIEQQNLQTLEDALNVATGVTIQRIDANRLNIFSRGFEVQRLLIDGLPTILDDRIFLAPHLARFESVAVLHGPAGIATGSGSAGGVINLTRKRPRGDLAIAAEVSAGSWQNYRGLLDVTGPLNDDRSLRARAVVSYQDREFFYDHSFEQDALLYGVGEYAVSDDVLLTVGGHYRHVDTRVPWTLPGYTDFTLLDVPRSTYLGADWNRDEFETQSVFAELEHNFGRGWASRLALRHGESAYKSDQAFAFFAVEPGVNTTSLFALRFDYSQQQSAIQFRIGGPFTAFGRRHEILIGAGYEVIDFVNPNYSADPFQITDSLNVFEAPIDIPKPEFTLAGVARTDTTESSLYSAARLQLADPLLLLLGGRLSWWDNELVEDGVLLQADGYNAVFTPNLGVVYDLSDTWSLYGSYSETYQPQTRRDVNGDLLDPLIGEQLEAGIKGGFFGGRLHASAALFALTETNRPLRDFTRPEVDVFFAQGEVENRGASLEISGFITPRWNIHAGYTYIDTEAPNETGSDTGTAFSAIAPEHNVTFWTHYRFGGGLRKWSVGGGFDYLSEIYNLIDGRRFSQDARIVVNARVGYRINEHFSTSLNVHNLLDERYYQRINTPNSGNIFGSPRAVTLELDMTF